MMERGAEVYGWSDLTGLGGTVEVGCEVLQTKGADPTIGNPSTHGEKERSETVVTQVEHERAT